MSTDPRRALEVYRRAAAMSPYHWQSRFNAMVVLYRNLQDPAGARRYLQELKRRQATTPNAPSPSDWERRLEGASG